MVVTVSELNSYVKEFIDANPIFNNIYVKGELSNFKHHSSGHCYMSLKDETSSIKAVMFKYSAMKLKFEPEDGMKVIVCARVSVYERDGVYQLYIEDMQPDGVGALHIKFEQLKEKLSKEGLFDERYKKKLPSFPETIGVVTSPSGAAVRDIINVVKRRYKKVNIIIFPATVQGEDAYKSIVEGIKYFNQNKVDVMIVGRGGGSSEDLWCFNEEAVARAIFASSVPVVSAVGHETDFTISDFAADLRAPTPSAAAELCVPDVSDVGEYTESMRKRLKVSITKMLELNRQKVLSIKNRNIFLYPERIFEKQNQYLFETSGKLTNAFSKNLTLMRERFVKNISKLDSLSPLKVLKRGYSFLEDEKGNIIASVSKIEINDNIRLKLADGTLKCKVTDKENWDG